MGVSGVLAVLWGIPFWIVFENPQAGAIAPQFHLAARVTRWLSAAAAVLLMVAGTGVIRRRWWGRQLIWVWAVAKIFIALLAALVGYLMFDYMTRDTPLPRDGFSLRGLLPLLSVVFGLLWAWVLPVFVFFWFGRQSIRSQVSAWR